MDKMDYLLSRLPCESPPEDLALRICQAIRARRVSSVSPFFWTGQRTRYFAWVTGLAGLALLLLLPGEMAGQPLSRERLLITLTRWPEQILQAPADVLTALGNQLPSFWHGLLSMSTTALPLALALLALAGFVQASYWLSEWNGNQQSAPKLSIQTQTGEI